MNGVGTPTPIAVMMTSSNPVLLAAAAPADMLTVGAVAPSGKHTVKDLRDLGSVVPATPWDVSISAMTFFFVLAVVQPRTRVTFMLPF